MAVSLATFNPCYTLEVVFQGENNSLVLASNVRRSNTKYDRPFTALPWNPTNANDDWATPWRQDYSVAISLLTGKNLAAGLSWWNASQWNNNAYVEVDGFVIGQWYLYTPGTYTYFSPDGLSRQSRPSPVIAAGAFLATQTTYYLSGAKGMITWRKGWNGAATAVLQQIAPLYLGSGIVVDQFQEMLDTRYVGTRRGKDFQLGITNTQGRIKLVGMRVDSEPGADLEGPML
jgi:hypothetical protein